MTTDNLSELTALIIDDQEFVLNIVRKMMEQIGFARVTTARDGREGLKVLPTVQPAVVVCDIEMRPMDGLTFLSELRKSPDAETRETPLIFLTAHGRHDLVTKARDLGADGFVTKPATVTLLKECILQAVARHAA